MPISCKFQALMSYLVRRREATQSVCLQITNLTRRSVLATCLEVADQGETRMKGLLGRDHLSPGEGLWILPCEAVHTFWMKFPIDLVYLNRRNQIRKLRSNVPPWRLSACFSAHSVLELAAGTIRGTQTQLGDTLEFMSVPLGVARSEGLPPSN
ncbi:MAG: DUF192 domain-containing protein [Terracidiphilus sp.]